MENTQKSRKATHHTWLLIHIRGGRKMEGMEFKTQAPFFPCKNKGEWPLPQKPHRGFQISQPWPPWSPAILGFVCLLVWLVDLLVTKPVLVVKKTEDRERANLISAILVGVLWKVNVWRRRAEVIDCPIRSALSKPCRDRVQAILWCSLILQCK